MENPLEGNIDLRFDFVIKRKKDNTAYVIIFFDGWSIEHALVYFEGESRAWFDYSSASMLIEKRLSDEIFERKGYEKCNWNCALWFFERESDPHTYLASRWHFFKEEYKGGAELTQMSFILSGKAEERYG